MQSPELFQDEFVAAIMDPMLATPEHIVDPSGKPTQKRFNVYRNNVITSLLEAMSQAFPIVEKLVGADFFREMSRVYIRNNPPSSPLMMFYGKNFPEFIAAFEPAQSVPYLSDIAQLEFVRRVSYFAEDAYPPEGGALAGIDPETIAERSYDLSPALNMVTSTFPIFDIWKRNFDDENHAISQSPQDVLITRPHMEVRVEPAPSGAYILVDELRKGATLGAAVENTLEKNPTADISQIIGLIIPHIINIKD